MLPTPTVVMAYSISTDAANIDRQPIHMYLGPLYIQGEHKQVSPLRLLLIFQQCVEIKYTLYQYNTIQQYNPSICIAPPTTRPVAHYKEMTTTTSPLIIVSNMQQRCVQECTRLESTSDMDQRTVKHYQCDLKVMRCDTGSQ